MSSEKPNFCESCAGPLATCDCATPRPITVGYSTAMPSENEKALADDIVVRLRDTAFGIEADRFADAHGRRAGILREAAIEITRLRNEAAKPPISEQDWEAIYDLIAGGVTVVASGNIEIDADLPQRIANALSPPARPDGEAVGWKLVPIEPTEAMVIAGCRHENMGDMAGRYAAMLDAAPAAPADADAGMVEAVEWVWYGEDADGTTHVSLGRWQKHPCQFRYKLADIQPAEHDRPAPSVAGALRDVVSWLCDVREGDDAASVIRCAIAAREAAHAALTASPAPDRDAMHAELIGLRALTKSTLEVNDDLHATLADRDAGVREERECEECSGAGHTGIDGDEVYECPACLGEGQLTPLRAVQYELEGLRCEYDHAAGILDAHSRDLTQIEELLSEGQGDDDGPQILPDFEPGWSTVAKVEACIHLLEKRRDALAQPEPTLAGETGEKS